MFMPHVPSAAIAEALAMLNDFFFANSLAIV
jgi:hypothetical protein